MAAAKRTKSTAPLPTRDKVQGSKLSIEQQAAALAFANLCSDAQAAKQAGISLRTLQNYRARLADDEKLAQLYKAKSRELRDEWKGSAVSTLLEGLETARVLMKRFRDAAGPPEKGQLFEVSGTIKIISEALTVKEVMGVSADDDPENAGAFEAPGRAPDGSEDSEDTAGDRVH